MSTREETTITLLNKLSTLTAQYAPEVIDAVVTSVQISAIGDLVMGVVDTIAAYAVWKLSVRLFRYSSAKIAEEGTLSDWTLARSLGTGGLIFLCFVLLISAGGALFDIWTYVGVFYPELALAHQVIGL